MCVFFFTGTLADPVEISTLNCCGEKNIYIHIFIYIYTNVYIYTYIYVNIYIYTHTYT